MNITKLADDLAGGAPVSGSLLILAAETLEALRADLEAVAVAAENIKDWHMKHGPLNPQHLPSMWVRLLEALARPGVVALLKGVKDG